VDSMSGGAGDDIYVVADTGDKITELFAAGTDTVLSSADYALAANIENLTLTSASHIGTGNTLNNTLTGSVGLDTLVGGAGNDTYVVQDTGDTVTELSNAGTDTVQSSVNYTLSVNVEHLTLTGSDAINGTGNVLGNVLTGNTAVNTLSGDFGNDTLDGGTGADTLAGGVGNDTYVVDDTGDLTNESNSEGTDTVRSSVNYTLADHVENLVLTGTAALTGTGNELANVITGNDGSNALTGGLGVDTLSGGAGADIFIFTAADQTGIGTGNRDVITDFSSSGGDQIDISGWDADPSADGVQTWSFVSSFNNQAGEVMFDATNHLVLFDNDGNGTADASIELTGVSTLSATDFIGAS